MRATQRRNALAALVVELSEKRASAGHEHATPAPLSPPDGLAIDSPLVPQPPLSSQPWLDTASVPCFISRRTGRIAVTTSARFAVTLLTAAALALVVLVPVSARTHS